MSNFYFRLEKGVISCIGLLLALILFFSGNVSGQRKYGNEWISYGQSYYKLKVVQSGIYRVSYTDLQNAGMSMSGLDATHLQLFFRGKETPIYLSTGSGTSFGTKDYIEFYGRGNDGALDTVLYLNPKDDINRSFSMYTDTAAYFLTIGTGSNNQRYSFTNKKYGNIPLALYTCGQDLNLHTVYNDGVPANSSLNFTGSDYNAGEGWMGNNISCTNTNKPVSLTYTINLINSYTPADTTNLPKPQLEILVYGKSDVELQNPDHHLVILSMPGNIPIWDTVYNGFQTIHKIIKRNWSDVAGKSQVSYAVEAAGVKPSSGTNTSDLEVVSFLRLRYLNTFGIDPNNPFLAFSAQNHLSSPQTDFNFTASSAPSSTRNLVLYDITHFKRTTNFQMSGKNAGFAIDNFNDSTNYLLYDTTQAIKPLSISLVNFIKPAYANNYNYIIVTNKAFTSGVQAFANYKITQTIDSAGTPFNPLTVYVDDLYDQFFYGVHHPAAIQNFMAYLYNNATQKPQYLMLMGKGIDNADERKYYSSDYVPGVGYPPADVMFTAGIDIGFQGRDKVIDPKMGIGRLQVQSNNDVLTYLNKLKQYDASLKAEPQYLKTAINVDGGDNGQIAQIQNFMDAQAAVLSKPNTGLKVNSYYSVANTAVNGDLKDVIQKNIQKGTSFFSYLGHGAAEQFQVDFADTTTLSNAGRYPIMYLNGCDVGNAFLPPNSSTYGGFYTLAANKGAIIWLSHSNEALDNVLYSQMGVFFKNVAVANYAKSVGSTWRKSITDLKAFDQDDDYRALLYEWNIQGDPSVRFPYQTKPDYAIYDSTLSVSPNDVISSSVQYRVSIPIINLGKTSSAKFKIRIKQTLPDNSAHTFDTVVSPVNYIDTLNFTIIRNNLNIQGINKFDVYVNSDSSIDETSLANDHASFSYYFRGNSVRPLFPTDFGIINTDTPSLISQSRDLQDYKTGIYFEIDTTTRFNSPLKQISPLLIGSSLISWYPKLNNKDHSGNLIDSTVYYWRTRMNLPADSGGEWNIHSFVYLKKGKPGWSQSHWLQYKNIQPAFMAIDTNRRTMEYLPSFSSFLLEANAFKFGLMSIKPENEFWQVFGTDIGSTTIAIIEYDKNTLKPYPYNRLTGKLLQDYYFSSLQSCNYIAYDMTQQTDRSQFQKEINLVPEGNYILLVSRGESKHQYLNLWDSSTFNAFKEFGDTMMPHLISDSVSYVIAGRKGTPKGVLIAEAYKNNTGSHTGDTAKLNVILQGVANDSGNITSQQIGPASEWHTMYQDYRSLEHPTSDQEFMNVHGVNKQGIDTILYYSIKTDSFDISKIDAQKYPYLKFQALLNDTLNWSPPQLKLWQAEYDGIPEGTLIGDSESIYPKNLYSVGDSVHLKIKFRNISDRPMSKVLVALTVKDALYNTITADSGYKKPINAGDFFWIDTTLPTKTLLGTNYLVVFVNPGLQQPEQTLDNNFVQFKFNVNSDKTNPLMDVTFDGLHIADGQVVSSDPAILVSVRDENKLQVLKDTSDYKIFLQYPDSLQAQRIHFSSPKINFSGGDTTDNNSTINYHPGPLGDGMYLFKAQATDASGNLSGPAPYSIHFKVINQPAISHFYLYPNPLTDISRFGFTMTGKEMPQMIEIQVFDMTGSRVKTLDLSGSGNLRAGVNEISWNGTDDNGAALNQGMYFYKAFVKFSGSNPVNYPLPEDEQLQQGFGKIIILREP